MKLKFNEDDLTVGDLEDIEDYTGQPWTGIKITEDENGQVQADLPIKLLTVLIWITGRHDNPDFTIEEARKVRVSELEVPSTNGLHPTKAASAKGSKRSRPSATSTRA